MSKISTEQKLEILDKYINKNYNCGRLSRDYNVTPRAIKSILLKNNVILRCQSHAQKKFFIYENYFDKIDTEEKAYFLGFLYADGCNYNKTSTISIGLQEEDRPILDRFSKLINSDRPLSFRKSCNPKRKNEYKMNIISKHISEQLIKLGCTPRKSLTLTFPNNEQVPYYLIRHFIRGLWDGDGCLSYGFYGKNSTLNCRPLLVSTVYVCESIKEILLIELDINSSIIRPRYSVIKDTTTRQLSINGNKQALSLLDWLYKDTAIYLERKYKNYLNFKNLYLDNINN